MDPKKILQWSPSRLFKYEECPAKAKFAFIDKIPEPGPKSKPLVDGERKHGHLESYIKGWEPELNPECSKVTALATTLREKHKAGKAHAEIKLGVTRQWKTCGWFDADTWGRFQLDILEVEDEDGRVIDWKSGKYKPDGEYSDQLNAYSTAALSVTPSLRKMTSCLVFVDHTEVPVERPEGTVLREDLGQAQEYWTNRVARMEADTLFIPKPGYACRWCPYAKDKGGPCEFRSTGSL